MKFFLRTSQFLILYAALLILHGCTSSPEKARSFKVIFDHYWDRENVVAISFPPGLTGLFLNGDDPDQAEIKQLMQELSVFRMLSVEQDSGDTGLVAELQSTVSDFTSRNGFEDLFRIQSDGQDIFIRILENEGVVREAIMMMNSDDSFFVINLRGNISMDHFMKLAEGGYLEGLAELRDLDLD